MITSHKVEHVGEIIRRLRRQKNMTQTELGANRYSKSYVSAVEKNSIRPSITALRFFAEQLDQRGDYFAMLLESTENNQQSTALPGPLEVGSHFLQDDGFSLLTLLMQQADPLSLQNLKGLPTLAPEILSALPPSRQCYYFLLQGLTALANQEYRTALQALEQALPLSPPQLQPQVLDALGQYYSLTEVFPIALHYHLRAYNSLKLVDTEEIKNSLLFTIALHCAEDYRALGNYERACMMYEQTRKHLRSDHEMKDAARLYLGLGYCTYALAYQQSQMPKAAEKALAGETEQEFQQAISYIVQSRSIYQVSGDRQGEAITRLMQTRALLDFITRYRQLVSPTTPIGATFAASGLSFLNNAEEQCQQVLIRWDEVFTQAGSEAQQDSLIYAALGQLLKIHIQRAALARLRGQKSTALRESISAVYLCQHVLAALVEPVLSPELVQQILARQSDHSMPDSPSLPHLPALHLESTTFNPRFTGLVEIYCAAGEVAEELGRTATSSKYRHDCYSQADHCFKIAIALAQTIVSAHQSDPGYLLRHYQRYASLLEERLASSPEDREETSHILAALMKEGFAQITALNT
jgi:tetratricopeptide (TPR) repeat protein/transcriptional regulator with XRE-family HTH domain